MFVRDCMTQKPVTVRPESDPLAAMMLIRSCGFRHLPVVREDGQLVGIVGQDGLELFLSKARSPGVIKRQHRVEQAMVTELVTVSPDCALEEAATLMVAQQLGSLPVVEAGKVVGIITEADIFRQFAAVLGGGSDSLRLTIQVDDTPGQLAKLAGRISEVNGNITSIVAYAADRPERINITLRVEGVEREIVLGAISDIVGFEVLDA